MISIDSTHRWLIIRLLSRFWLCAHVRKDSIVRGPSHSSQSPCWRRDGSGKDRQFRHPSHKRLSATLFVAPGELHLGVGRWNPWNPSYTAPALVVRSAIVAVRIETVG